MKILLTGATGFLGSQLTRVLLATGHELVILKRSFSDTSRIAALLPQLTSYDIDEIPLEEVFRNATGIEAIIHTATSYGRKGETCAEIYSTNTAFPLRLVELAANCRVATFINTDTSLPKFLNSYSLSKRHFSEWGRFFAAKSDIRFANLELEHFYGAGDDASKFTTNVIHSCVNNLPELKLTLGEQRRDFIHINDVLSAYLLVLDAVRANEEFYLNFGVGSGQPVSIREFVETVHHLSRSSTKLDFGAIPYRESEVMDSCADLTALTALGWRPDISLVDGIAMTINAERVRGIDA